MPGGGGKHPLKNAFGEDREVVHFTVLLAIEVSCSMYVG